MPSMDRPAHLDPSPSYKEFRFNPQLSREENIDNLVNTFKSRRSDFNPSFYEKMKEFLSNPERRSKDKPYEQIIANQLYEHFKNVFDFGKHHGERFNEIDDPRNFSVAPAPVQAEPAPAPVSRPRSPSPDVEATAPAAQSSNSRPGFSTPVPVPRAGTPAPIRRVLDKPESTVVPTVTSRTQSIRPYSGTRTTTPAPTSRNAPSPLTREWLERHTGATSNFSSLPRFPSTSSMMSTVDTIQPSARPSMAPTPRQRSREATRASEAATIDRDLLDSELANQTSRSTRAPSTSRSRDLSAEDKKKFISRRHPDMASVLNNLPEENLNKLYKSLKGEEDSYAQLSDRFKEKYPGKSDQYYKDIRDYIVAPGHRRLELRKDNPDYYSLVDQHMPILANGEFDIERFKKIKPTDVEASHSRSRVPREDVDGAAVPSYTSEAAPAPMRAPSPSSRLERPEGFYPGQRSNANFPIKLSSPDTLYRVEKNAQELENIIPYLPMMTPSQKNDVFNSARELWEIFNNVGDSDALDNVTRRKFATGLESLKHFERALKSASVAPDTTITRDDLKRYKAFNPPEESQIKLNEMFNTPFQHERINLLPKKIRTRVENPDGTIGYEDIEESNDDLLRRHALTSGLTALQNESEEPLVGSTVLQPSPEQKFARDQILDELEGRENFTPKETDFIRKMDGRVSDGASLGRLNQGTEDIPWANEVLRYNTKEAHDLRKPVSEEDIARYDLSDKVDGWLSKLRKKAERTFNENEEKYSREADSKIGQFANRGSWNSGSRIAMEEQLRKERERRRRDFETDMNELESRSMLDSKKNALGTAMNARKMGQEFFLNQMNAQLGKDKDNKARLLQGATLGHGMRHEDLRAEQNRNVAQMELERDLARRRQESREYKYNLANQDQELKRRGMIAQISDIDQARTAPFRNAQRFQGLINGATPTNQPIFNPSLSAPLPNVPAPTLARTSELKAQEPNAMNQLLGIGALGLGSYLGKS